MKTVAVLLFLTLAGCTKQEDDDRTEKIKQYRDDCIAETKVDPALIDRADNGDFVDDAKLQCFSKCFYQKAGFVAENGDLLFDVIKAKIPKEANREKALAIIDKCKDLKGADSCETVYLVHKCYFLHSYGSDKKSE
ncbi:general odorant-binding protein 56d-like [Tribolium madens]|uniref:general odorant-binding protein 56d-like n=1 Tax=Tribolium madens TaxID=41895 RepID=UPI001CF7527C|nr:general odorant-binding protein 56d-like [Tribolium madens]